MMRVSLLWGAGVSSRHAFILKIEIDYVVFLDFPLPANDR